MDHNLSQTRKRERRAYHRLHTVVFHFELNYNGDLNLAICSMI